MWHTAAAENVSANTTIPENLNRDEWITVMVLLVIITTLPGAETLQEAETLPGEDTLVIVTTLPGAETLIIVTTLQEAALQVEVEITIAAVEAAVAMETGNPLIRMARHILRACPLSRRRCAN